MNNIIRKLSMTGGSKLFNFITLFISTIFVVLVLAGCAGIPISYYDSTTYTQLTSLKAETTLLIENLIQNRLVKI